MEEVTLNRNDDLHKDEPIVLSLKHAENLLKLQVAKGYKHYSLPVDSKYEFKDGNLKRKPDTNTAPVARTRRSNRKGEAAGRKS